MRNGDVLLVNSGNLVLLDEVVNGEDSQSSAVSDDTNDLIPQGPRTCTIHVANDEYSASQDPTLGVNGLSSCSQ